MIGFWNWFDGKKTVISAIMALVINFLQVKHVFDDDTVLFLLALNTIFMSLGIGHKVIKSKNDTQTNS